MKINENLSGQTFIEFIKIIFTTSLLQYSGLHILETDITEDIVFKSLRRITSNILCISQVTNNSANT